MQTTDPVTLPLPPVQPYDQQLAPALDGDLHLLWLDHSDSDQISLYAALLRPDLGIERGPTVISESLALRYTLLPLGDGQVMVLWSGGLMAEPTLYTRHITAQGLAPQPALELASAADWPAVIQANDGTRYLFWLDTGSQSPRFGLLTDRGISAIESLNQAFRLAPGDRLFGLYAGLDRTHLYLLWNITRRSGKNESGMIARALEFTEWSAPQRLGLTESASETLQTGLNTGLVHEAQAGERWLSWAAPLPGQFDVLPVAAQWDNDLVIAYFQAGRVAGVQRVSHLSALLRPPILRTDRDRYLYLAWSEPDASGAAQLKLFSTRP